MKLNQCKKYRRKTFNYPLDKWYYTSTFLDSRYRVKTHESDVSDYMRQLSSGWIVFDSDSFYNKIAKRNLEIRKPYLVVRQRSDGMMNPKKSFNTFDQALDYCHEKSWDMNEHDLHCFQKRVIAVKTEQQLYRLILKAMDFANTVISMKTYRDRMA